MSLPGQMSVTQGGAATYSIPISIPPGAAGFAPSLSINYNSQGPNGLLGVGWSLGGLSAIGRCPRTVAQDGVVGGVNFDANDRFCLDGRRLVAISGAYGADGTEYRTEIDSYAKIISHGTAGSGPAWFEVHTKSGLTMEYGHTADSQIVAQGKSSVQVWAVNSSTDLKSNYYTVTYTNNSSVGQFQPAHVDYGGNTAGGTGTYNSIVFSYEGRPDVITQYQSGSVSQTALRLTGVKAYASGNLVTDYRMGFQQSPTSNASELISLTLCNGSSACLPPVAFQWDNGGGTAFTGRVMTITNGEAFGTPPTNDYLQVTGDFTGDGRADFVMLRGPNLFGFLSNGDGTYAIANSAAPNGWNFGTSVKASYTLINGDFNGDGRAEFALLNGAYLYVFMSNGDGTFTGTTFQCPNGWNFGGPPDASYTSITGDFNGDGRTDFLMLGGAYLYEFLSVGDGTFTGNTIAISNGWNFGGPPASSFTPVIGDFNGDGKTDFIMMGGTYLYQFIANGNGTFSYIQTSTGWNFGGPPRSHYMPITGDFNGDGKTDWAMLNGPNLYEFLSKGDGTFIYNAIAISGWNFGDPAAANFESFSGDFNRDGKSDFALIGGNGPYIYLFSSNGDGSFTYRTIAMPNSWNFGAPPRNNYAFTSGDFNGDGRLDFLLMDSTHIYTVTADGGAGDLVKGASSGLGATTTITYAPLTASSVYAKDGNAHYPQLDLQAPIYVVSRLESPNGIGGVSSSTYAYAGAKVDLTGRGMLGFRQMTVRDEQTGISSTTTYQQDFPFTGSVSSVTSRNGSQVIGSKSYQYMWISPGLGGVPQGTAIGVNSPSASPPYSVMLSQAVSSGSDLDGSALPTVTTSNQYDTYGNPTQVTVSTSDGFSRTSVNTYSNDPTLWYLGRLTRSVVTSTAP